MGHRTAPGPSVPIAGDGERCPFPWAGPPKQSALQVNQECLQGTSGPDQCGAASTALSAAHLHAGEGAALLPPHHGPGVPPASGSSPLPSRYPWALLFLFHGRSSALHGVLLPSPFKTVFHTVLPLQPQLLPQDRSLLRSCSPCCQGFCLCSQPVASWSTSLRTCLRSWVSLW